MEVMDATQMDIMAKVIAVCLLGLACTEVVRVPMVRRTILAAQGRRWYIRDVVPACALHHVYAVVLAQWDTVC